MASPFHTKDGIKVKDLSLCCVMAFSKEEDPKESEGNREEATSKQEVQADP